jgi:antitoxin StbD
MKAILTDMTISISEFKANPNKAVQDADGLPFCVLTNNAPAFYVVGPETWQKIDDIIQDRALLEVAQKRSREWQAQQANKKTI